MPGKNRFLSFWAGAISLYFLLTAISLSLSIYRVFPAWGFIGYTLVILLLLAACAEADKRWQFLLSGITLVIAGLAASVDIVLSRPIIVAELQTLESAWAQQLFNNENTVNNLVNVLVILLNIFTSSLAANILFYGLNRHNFKH